MRKTGDLSIEDKFHNCHEEGITLIVIKAAHENFGQSQAQTQTESRASSVQCDLEMKGHPVCGYLVIIFNVEEEPKSTTWCLY